MTHHPAAAPVAVYDPSTGTAVTDLEDTALAWLCDGDEHLCTGWVWDARARDDFQVRG